MKLPRSVVVSVFSVTSVVLTAMLALLQCSVEDEQAGARRQTQDEAGDPDALAAADAPEGGVAVIPGLCPKVGGQAVVDTIANQIFDNAAADCRIGVYFTALEADAVTHVKECMRRHLGEVFQCPDSTYAGFKSSTGRVCRDIASAHAGLVGGDGKPGLNASDALAYVQGAQAAMKANGMTDSDITRVIALFNAYQSAVAPRISERNTFCTCPGGQFEGTQCAPDGGYVIPQDAAKDVKVDTGSNDAAKDTSTANDAADTGSNDTGPG